MCVRSLDRTPRRQRRQLPMTSPPDVDGLPTADEIAALALVLQAHTAAHQISSMELRAVLEFLRGRGYLVRPRSNDYAETT
jgi:hypothetical protein